MSRDESIQFGRETSPFTKVNTYNSIYLCSLIFLIGTCLSLTSVMTIQNPIVMLLTWHIRQCVIEVLIGMLLSYYIINAEIGTVLQDSGLAQQEQNWP